MNRQLTCVGIVALFVGVGLGWLGSNVHILGEGTWDGQSGGESTGDSASLTTGRRSEKVYGRHHIVWIWKPAFIDFKPELKTLCEKAQRIFGGLDEWHDRANGEQFWADLANLRIAGHSEIDWRTLVYSVKKKDSKVEYWTFRAFNDTDTKGRHYKAIEATAPIIFDSTLDAAAKAKLQSLLSRHLENRSTLTAAEKTQLTSALESTFAKAAGLKEIMFPSQQ
jgi:hypothetical protein